VSVVCSFASSVAYICLSHGWHLDAEENNTVSARQILAYMLCTHCAVIMRYPVMSGMIKWPGLLNLIYYVSQAHMIPHTR